MPFSAAARKPGSSLPCSWVGIWRSRVAKLPSHSGSNEGCNGSISGPTSSTMAPSASKRRAACGDQRGDLGVGLDMAELEAEAEPAARARPARGRSCSRAARRAASASRADRDRPRAFSASAASSTVRASTPWLTTSENGEVGGMLGDAAEARLEADQAGVRGRDADRAAAVVAVVEADRCRPPSARRRRPTSRPACGRGSTDCA